MAANPGPQTGINAWLEEELLQQYRYDRASVDADWKEVFDHERPGNGASNGAVVLAGNGRTGNGNGAIHSPANAATHHGAPCRTRTVRLRRIDAPARNRRAHRREHGDQRDHSAGHFAANHSRQGRRREPASDQPPPDSARQEQGLLHAPDRLGDREVRHREPVAEPRLRRRTPPANCSAW